MRLLHDCIFFTIVDASHSCSKREVDKWWEEQRRLAAQIRTHSEHVKERAWRISRGLEREKSADLDPLAVEEGKHSSEHSPGSMGR